MLPSGRGSRQKVHSEGLEVRCSGACPIRVQIPVFQNLPDGLTYHVSNPYDHWVAHHITVSSKVLTCEVQCQQSRVMTE